MAALIAFDARRFIVSATLTLALLGCISAIAPVPARAEEAPPAEPDSGKRFTGIINANAVTIRSRPAEESSNVALRVDKGTRVTVVGIKYNFLKILPPKGAFSYIPKAWVERHGDPKVGKVTRETITRAGSTENELAGAVQTKVEEGKTVTILDEKAEYFRIIPPDNTFLWVNKQFVDPYKEEPQEKQESDHGSNDSTGTLADRAKARGKEQKEPKRVETADARTNGPTGSGDTQDTVDETGTAATQPEAASQPADTVAADFEKLEKDYKATGEKGITEQPVPTLLAGYEALAKEKGLPESMRRTVLIRIATLKVRNEFREYAVSHRKAQEEEALRKTAMEAERQEIVERIKDHDVAVFTAVGTLRTSSIQVGPGTLYRLTDPATGRTVCYLRTTDAKYANLLGQFIGVKGTLGSDNQFKQIINKPAEPQAVDPAKVNTSIAAQIVPASLMPRVGSVGQARTDDK